MHARTKLCIGPKTKIKTVWSNPVSFFVRNAAAIAVSLSLPRMSGTDTSGVVEVDAGGWVEGDYEVVQTEDIHSGSESEEGDILDSDDEYEGDQGAGDEVPFTLVDPATASSFMQLPLDEQVAQVLSIDSWQGLRRVV